MSRNSTKVPSFFLAITALSGWFALTAQFYLIMVNRIVPVTETIIRFFSFFTILTNIIVAICVTVLLLKPNSKWGSYFSKPFTVTAITVYIVIVGVVYNLILRFLWQPQGLQLAVDELLHTIIPMLFVFMWILYIPKAGLQYKNALPWLTYPFVYLIYTAIRGEITGYYPYPFIHVTELGYARVAMNAGALVAAFLGLSLFLIAVGKYTSRKNT